MAMPDVLRLYFGETPTSPTPGYQTARRDAGATRTVTRSTPRTRACHRSGGPSRASTGACTDWSSTRRRRSSSPPPASRRCTWPSAGPRSTPETSRSSSRPPGPTAPRSSRLANATPRSAPPADRSGTAVMRSTSTRSNPRSRPARVCSFYTSPSNPLGWNGHRGGAAKACWPSAREHGLWLIADEVYERLFYRASERPGDPRRPRSCASATREDAVLVVHRVVLEERTCMTGWRVGWFVCPSEFGPRARRTAERVRHLTRGDVLPEGRRGRDCGRRGLGARPLLADLRAKRDLCLDRAFERYPALHHADPDGRLLSLPADRRSFEDSFEFCRRLLIEEPRRPCSGRCLRRGRRRLGPALLRGRALRSRNRSRAHLALPLTACFQAVSKRTRRLSSGVSLMWSFEKDAAECVSTVRA